MSTFGKTVLTIFIVLALGALFYAFFFVADYQTEVTEVPTPTPPSTPQIEGNRQDLVSFSVKPGDKVSGVLAYEGVIQGAYFFEANILINILDKNKNVLKADHTMATTDWMTAGPVSFGGIIDLTGLPKGEAYFEIHNDNASGLPEHDKFIRIPIVIE